MLPVLGFPFEFSMIFLLVGLYFLSSKRLISFILVLFIMCEFLIFTPNLSDYKTYVSLIVVVLFSVIIISLDSKTFDVILLFIMVLVGSITVISSDDLILVYIGLELQTFSSLVLISNSRQSLKNSEAGLKYFTLGSISSGLFLLSLSLIYYYSGDLSITNLSGLIHEETSNLWEILLVVSLFFKLSIFPLHFWIPDIYESLNYDILLLISSIPKISIIILIIKLNISLQLILWCGILSIIVGTLGAVNQTKVKRLLAYSGISQMGFILVIFTLVLKTNLQVIFIYSLIYFISLIGFINLLNVFWGKIHKNLFISELSGVQNFNSVLTASLFLIILSVAGLPPLMGFIPKWLVISNLMLNEYVLISLVCLILSGLSIFYYLRIGKILYFQRSSSFLTWSSSLSNTLQGNNEINTGILIYFVMFFILNLSWILLFLDYIIINF